MEWLSDLNALYADRPALWNDDEDGFEWVNYGDRKNSVLSYLRTNGDDTLLFVINFTPVVREDYRVGVPAPGTWTVRLNSDDAVYGGSGVRPTPADSEAIEAQGREHSISLTLPPLGALILEREA
jgi:1,4-alpha-glucan branching enzyme